MNRHKGILLLSPRESLPLAPIVHPQKFLNFPVPSRHFSHLFHATPGYHHTRKKSNMQIQSGVDKWQKMPRKLVCSPL